MGFAFIREGDTTSHGGRVLACDPTNTVDGKALALLGTMVSCPKCSGVFPIVKVKRDLNMTFGGVPVASDGDMTACGATLIATQSSATASPTGGMGNPIGGGRSVVAQQASADQTGPHRGRFQVLDDDTGMPVANHPYTVTGSDGSTITGTTDENGYTNWLETGRAASLSFERSGPSSV
ncbi:hypothetical protein WI76_09205 [Burkholderia ubonensis]|uniref:PAAR domain-containing protein n=1 Tax=Burkholderia ubonensis TaxID=101571 RepID=UPI00075CFC19|nr:PAAR domain-containing protein [Burkholderia ubonensis]KVC82483.1 hypothetical protein WI76_09205 [Burkholderia ubonensis]